MQLQLALDTCTSDEAVRWLPTLATYLDIIEVGTPVILREGMAAVTRLKAHYPDKRVVADIKIMDAGAYEAEIAFDAGADIVTVLGVAGPGTRQAACRIARERGRQVMIDGIEVPDLPAMAPVYASEGVHILCAHTAWDRHTTGADTLAELKALRPLRGRSPLQVAVAGGVTPANIGAIVALQPDIVIVGGGITTAGDPVDAARRIKEACPP